MNDNIWADKQLWIWRQAGARGFVDMHEVDIASSILESVHRELHRYPRHRAAKVGLRVGEFVGVDRELLQFCFDLLVKGTEVDPLQLEIEWCRAENGRSGYELDIAFLEVEETNERSADMNRVSVENKVLSENDQIASRLRAGLAAAGALSLNFIGSPGAGRTALLERTLERLPAHTRAAVLTGDVQTENDAIRLRHYGYPVRQIATPGACHLEACMVERHLTGWLKEGLELLLIENVGNLVCSASYDLGEDAKVLVFSTEEGEDKPLQNPGIVRKAELMVLNKIDLLPHVPFDIDLAQEYARRINPGIEIIRTSCTTGIGLDRWLEWLTGRAERKKASAKLVTSHG